MGRDEMNGSTALQEHVRPPAAKTIRHSQHGREGDRGGSIELLEGLRVLEEIAR